MNNNFVLFAFDLLNIAFFKENCNFLDSKKQRKKLALFIIKLKALFEGEG